MTKLNSVLLITLFGLLLSACEGSPTTAPQNKSIPIIGNADNGLVYYQAHCSTCHAAGGDTTTAFNSSDLSNLFNSDRLDIIKSDMSSRGGIKVNNGIVELMGRFKHISPQRVADLKAFLKKL